MRLYWAVAFEPVGQIIISKFRMFELSVFLKRISKTTLAFVAPVTIRVSVFIAKPEARSMPGYAPVSVAKDVVFDELFIMLIDKNCKIFYCCRRRPQQLLQKR